MGSEWEPLEFIFAGFAWDNEKAEINRQKHGIDFEDASRIFKEFVLAKAQFEDGEDRWQRIGVTKAEEVLAVITERSNRCRIISARRASKSERQRYYAFFL